MSDRKRSAASRCDAHTIQWLTASLTALVIDVFWFEVGMAIIVSAFIAVAYQFAGAIIKDIKAE